MGRVPLFAFEAIAVRRGPAFRMGRSRTEAAGPRLWTDTVRGVQSGLGADGRCPISATPAGGQACPSRPGLGLVPGRSGSLGRTTVTGSHSTAHGTVCDPGASRSAPAMRELLSSRSRGRGEAELTNTDSVSAVGGQTTKPLPCRGRGTRQSRHGETHRSMTDPAARQGPGGQRVRRTQMPTP